MFTRVILIRHGQTEWNKKGRIQGQKDVPLNETGERQIMSLAVYLSSLYPLEIILTSPAVRALRTAEIINEKYGVGIETNRNLIEIDFGDLNDYKLADLPTALPDYFHQFEHFITTNRTHGTRRPELPNGESFLRIEERLHAFIKTLLAEHAGKHVAAVTHGSYIKCLMAVFSGESLMNYMPYWVENASLSIVDFYGHLPVMRLFNDTSHLGQPLAFAAPWVI